jgi:hypothetical protein
LALGDFNGDGKLDMAVVNSQDATINILLNNGNAGFGGSAPYALGASRFFSFSSIAAADLNGDGKLDLAVSGRQAELMILIGNGDGSFQTPSNQGTGNGQVAVADFNGDGFPDVAVTNGNGVALREGNGDGTFQPALNYATGNSPFFGSDAAGDFNGDGRPDLAVANGGSNTLTILINTGQVSSSFTLAATPASPSVAAGSSASFTVTATTQNGFHSAVSLTCTAHVSGATCTASPSSITPTAGGANSAVTVATSFSTPVGTYPVTVTGTSGNESFTVTPSIIVQAAPPPDFQISASAFSPATVAAGSSATATITVAPVGGFSASVTLSCSSITLNGSAATAAAPSCSFNPAQVANGSGTSIVTVTTTATSALSIRLAKDRLEVRRALLLLITGAAALLGAGLRRRKTGLRHLLPLRLLLASCFLLAACGGGGSVTSGGSGGTPAGSYTVAVTASAQGTSHPLNLTLIVQ